MSDDLNDARILHVIREHIRTHGAHHGMPLYRLTQALDIAHEMIEQSLERLARAGKLRIERIATSPFSDRIVSIHLLE